MALSWRKDLARYQKYFLDIQAFYKRRQDFRIFLEIILSLATITLFAVLALRPTLTTISQLMVEIRLKEKNIEKMDAKIKNLQTAQGLYNSQQEGISLLKSAIPSLPSPDSLVNQINLLAAKEEVSILGTSVGEVDLDGSIQNQKKDKDLKPLPTGANGFNVSLSASGTYQQLTSFLTNLENLRRPISIDSLDFALSKQDQEIRLVLTISGRGIFYPEERKGEPSGKQN